MDEEGGIWMKGGRHLLHLSDYLPFIDDSDEECSLSHVPQRKVEKGGVVAASQRLQESAAKNADKTSLNREKDMESFQSHYFHSSHRSLQRPGRKPVPPDSSPPPSSSRDDASVVWLGRYPQSFVAAGPVSVLGGNSHYELSDDFQQSIRSFLERKYGERAHWAATVIQRAFRNRCMERKFQQVRNSALQKFARLQAQEGVTRKRERRNPVYFAGAHPYRPVGPQAFIHVSEPQRYGQRFAFHSGLASPPVSRHPPPKPTRTSSSAKPPVNNYASVGLRLHRYNVNSSKSEELVDSRSLVRVSSEGCPGHAYRQSSFGSQETFVQPPNHLIQVRVSKGVRAESRNISAQRSQPPVVRVSQSNRSTSAERTSSGTRVIAYASGHYPKEEKRAFGVSQENLESTLKRSEGYMPEYSPSQDLLHLSHSSSNFNRPSSSRSGSEADITPTSDLSYPDLQKISPNGKPVWLPQPTKGRREESPIPPLRHLASSDAILGRASTDPKIQGVKVLPSPKALKPSQSAKVPEVHRKRQYRIALNFFNKKPDRGMQFLIDLGFIRNDPGSVAQFLMTRRGLSKQMIGEYLGNLQNAFNGVVLECFVGDIDFTHMDIDVALRNFQTYFRLPGEAQKIERIMEVFAHRYSECNPEVVGLFQSADTVFILAFAVIMLNTDLHSPNIKPERRMKLEEFVKNLRGIDGGKDVSPSLLSAIYNRIKEEEFVSGTDHTTQVLKVDLSVTGKKPTLPLPHRRLVCYCRLYEIEDPAKKQSPTVHQREIFLFNDLILITKIMNRKKLMVTYGYRQSHSLVGMQVQSFKNQFYPHGLKLVHTLENKTLYFHARSEEDKVHFLEDLREAVIESDEMEALRIELELEKQSLIRPGVNTLTRTECQRDSGLPDLSAEEGLSQKHRALSNSMLELGLDTNVPAVASSASARAAATDNRRASLNSLDSGMSSTASVGSRESSPQGSNGEKRSGSKLNALFSKNDPATPRPS